MIRYRDIDYKFTFTAYIKRRAFFKQSDSLSFPIADFAENEIVNCSVCYNCLWLGSESKFLMEIKFNGKQIKTFTRSSVEGS